MLLGAAKWPKCRKVNPEVTTTEIPVANKTAAARFLEEDNFMDMEVTDDLDDFPASEGDLTDTSSHNESESSDSDSEVEISTNNNAILGLPSTSNENEADNVYNTTKWRADELHSSQESKGTGKDVTKNPNLL